MAETAALIFDRALQRRRLARALANGRADFLFHHVAEELVARLAGVQRDFAVALDLGSATPGLAALLARPGRTVVRAGPIADAGGDLVADEEALPFRDCLFDLVACALALQNVNDLPGALVQIRRALRPDGLFIAALVGGRSLFELRAAFTQAQAELEGGASPRVAPFADVRELGRLLQRAGFALPVADSEETVVRYDSMFGLMADLRAMGATNTLLARARTPLRRATLMRAAQIYAERYADPDGRVRATFEFVWASGWAPHESQQRPLAPGSAKMRLADALSALRKS